jgi:hypothetical protein
MLRYVSEWNVALYQQDVGLFPNRSLRFFSNQLFASRTAFSSVKRLKKFSSFFNTKQNIY